MAPLGRDHRLPEARLWRAAPKGRAAVAGCVWRDGVAASGRPVAYGAGYCGDGEVLRRALAHDLSLTLLRHGRLRAAGRRTRALYWRVDGAIQADHKRQWRGVASVAASVPLEDEDVFTG